MSRSSAKQSRSRRNCSEAAFLFPLILLFVTVLPLAGRGKDKLPYGEGLIVNIPLAESEVAQVVEDVAQNGVIRGTKEYNKDEYVSGAKSETSSHVFPAWNEGGKVFYKVRTQAIDPRNFKDSGDVGTLVVRYVVLAQGNKNTVLRIDALFQEDFRHTVHQSDGSVESAEYKDIREHLDSIEVMKKQTEEAESERQEQRAKKQKLAAQNARTGNVLQYEPPADSPVKQAAADPPPGLAPAPNAGPGLSSADVPTADLPNTGPERVTVRPSEDTPPPTRVPGQTLEERVKDLRKQVERLVKSPGAPLKSAPFHTASTLQSLTPGTEVLILISTPYWYGVETHEGQHGWIQRDELEQP